MGLSPYPRAFDNHKWIALFSFKSKNAFIYKYVCWPFYCPFPLSFLQFCFVPWNDLKFPTLLLFFIFNWQHSDFAEKTEAIRKALFFLLTSNLLNYLQFNPVCCKLRASPHIGTRTYLYLAVDACCFWNCYLSHDPSNSPSKLDFPHPHYILTLKSLWF